MANRTTKTYGRAKKRYEDPIAPFVMPSDTQAEIAVIGCVMMYKDLIDRTVELVSREMIWTVYYQGIWDAITALIAKQSPIDINTIISECIVAGHLPENADTEQTSVLRGRLLDAQCLVIGNRSSHETYCESLRFAHERRCAILTAQNLIQATLNAWVPDDMDVAKAEAAGDLAGRSKDLGTVSDMQIILDEVYDAAAERASSDGPRYGVPTPFQKLNDVLGGGIQEADLVVIAGRPSMGKTALATQFGIHACANGRHVVMYSLEMSKHLIGTRVFSMIASVQSHLIRNATNGDTNWQALVDARAFCQDMKMRWSVDDRSDHTPSSIAAASRILARERGPIGMIIVDYLDLVRPDRLSDSRPTEIGDICRDMKSLAKFHNCPVLLLCQIARKSEERGDKVPQMSDIADSSKIEAAADVILFPWRPGYYQSLKSDAANIFRQEEVDLIVAKQRNGPRCMVKVGFVQAYTRFEELNEMGQLGDSHVPDNVRSPYKEDDY